MEVFEVTKKPATKLIGQEAEKVAANYLKAHGLKHIKSNFSCKYGEIDLIMQHKDYLVFVEVRYRKHQQFGNGADSVNFHKQQKILKSAEFFLQQHVRYNQHPCRIDVVSIGPGKNDISWIANAVEA